MTALDTKYVTNRYSMIECMYMEGYKRTQRLDRNIEGLGYRWIHLAGIQENKPGSEGGTGRNRVLNSDKRKYKEFDNVMCI